MIAHVKVSRALPVSPTRVRLFKVIEVLLRLTAKLRPLFY